VFTGGKTGVLPPALIVLNRGTMSFVFFFQNYIFLEHASCTYIHRHFPKVNLSHVAQSTSICTQFIIIKSKEVTFGEKKAAICSFADKKGRGRVGWLSEQ
jgi:hypothetical protein